MFIKPEDLSKILVRMRSSLRTRYPDPSFGPRHRTLQRQRAYRVSGRWLQVSGLMFGKPDTIYPTPGVRAMVQGPGVGDFTDPRPRSVKRLWV